MSRYHPIRPQPLRLLLHPAQQARFLASIPKILTRRSVRHSSTPFDFQHITEPPIPVDFDLAPTEQCDPDCWKKEENTWAVAWAEKRRVRA
jgi:hypothetical protein